MMNLDQNQTGQIPQSHLDLLYLLPANAQFIVEFGCGTGMMGSQYKQINPHCFYLGIESDAERASLAQKQLDQVMIADGYDFELSATHLAPSTVDCIIYPQHLSNRFNLLKALKSHRNWLKPEGQVIADFVNAQYWQNILQLLQGNLQTPLHSLFTLEAIQTLFREAELQIYEIQTKGQKPESFQQFINLFKPVIQQLGIQEHQFTTQTAANRYIVRATKNPTAPRRLLIQTAMMAPTACDRVRVLEPDRLSMTIPGIRASSAAKALPKITPLPQEEKVFIWQRTMMSKQQHLPLLKQLLRQDYLIIAEIDDNPLRRKEYADNDYLSYRGCHAVQTSTQPLATFLKQLNPNVAVFQNQLAYLPPPRKQTKTDKITLFFGALNREQDWQPIMATLNKVLQQYSHRIQAQIIHDQRFFNSLQIQQKTLEPFCRYERYQEILHRCDIALLPLSPTPVNLMKSDLKFVECAGHGVAVLASPTVYEQSIILGETGLIYRTLQQFETQLHQLITNPQLRYDLATNAYHWVRNHRLLCQHYPQRQQWYKQLRDRLPQLNQELRQRVPELFID